MTGEGATRLPVTVAVDAAELRAWADTHADAGHHGVAHVLYKAAEGVESVTEQHDREVAAQALADETGNWADWAERVAEKIPEDYVDGETERDVIEHGIDRLLVELGRHWDEGFSAGQHPANAGQRGGAAEDREVGAASIDLRSSGLLWLINTTVFHPRGFALGLDSAGRFTLLGDGSEAWVFEEVDAIAALNTARATFAAAAGQGLACGLAAGASTAETGS